MTVRRRAGWTPTSEPTYRCFPDHGCWGTATHELRGLAVSSHNESPTNVHIETLMTEFVDLQRRFHELTDSELEDIDVLVSWSGSEYGPDVGWSKLLEYARVILLAEAGAGKTAEMQEQANRLTGEDGRFAFFLPLESLGSRSRRRHPFGRQGGTARTVEKRDGQEPAWFFLDAVDELKLTQGKAGSGTESAPQGTIDGHLNRARIIISCRPSDWRSGSGPEHGAIAGCRCRKYVATRPSDHRRRGSSTRSAVSAVDRRIPPTNNRKLRIKRPYEQSPCFR